MAVCGGTGLLSGGQVLGSWETGPACALAGLGDCCSCFSGGSHPIDVDAPSMALCCSLSEMVVPGAHGLHSVVLCGGCRMLWCLEFLHTRCCCLILVLLSPTFCDRLILTCTYTRMGGFCFDCLLFVYLCTPLFLPPTVPVRFSNLK